MKRNSLMGGLVLSVCMLASVALGADVQVGRQVVLNGGTNNCASLSTNYTSGWTNYIACDNNEDVALTLTATTLPNADSGTGGTLSLLFQRGDGANYETTPGLNLGLIVSATNTTSTAITNWTVGGIGKLKLIGARWTATNCYATNITLSVTRKAKVVKANR